MLDISLTKVLRKKNNVKQMKMKDTSNSNYTIIEVWSNNLEEEFKKIRKIIQKYPFVAMVLIFIIIFLIIKEN